MRGRSSSAASAARQPGWWPCPRRSTPCASARRRLRPGMRLLRHRPIATSRGRAQPCGVGDAGPSAGHACRGGSPSLRRTLPRHGEPLLNYEQCNPRGADPVAPGRPGNRRRLHFHLDGGRGPSHPRFAAERHRFRLIISLAAATSEARLPLMPAEKRWPLADVMAAVREYAASCRSRLSFAYIGISGVNMGCEHARKLAELLAGLRAKVTLIDVNDDSGRSQPPTDEEVREFRERAAGPPHPGVPPLCRRPRNRRRLRNPAATRAGGVVL